MKTSPCQRSLALLRSKGYTCGITEHYNQFSRVRNDLFGFIDILCIIPNEIRAIQTTSTANISARVKKILALESAKVFLQAGGTITVQGWSKKGGKGKRKLWQVTEKEIFIEDFDNVDLTTTNKALGCPVTKDKEKAGK